MGGCGCSDERTRWISGQPLIKFGTMNASGQITFDGDTVAVDIGTTFGDSQGTGTRAMAIEYRPGQWSLVGAGEVAGKLAPYTPPDYPTFTPRRLWSFSSGLRWESLAIINYRNTPTYLFVEAAINQSFGGRALSNDDTQFSFDRSIEGSRFKPFPLVWDSEASQLIGFVRGTRTEQTLEAVRMSFSDDPDADTLTVEVLSNTIDILRPTGFQEVWDATYDSTTQAYVVLEKGNRIFWTSHPDTVRTLPAGHSLRVSDGTNETFHAFGIAYDWRRDRMLISDKRGRVQEFTIDRSSSPPNLTSPGEWAQFHHPLGGRRSPEGQGLAIQCIEYWEGTMTCVFIIQGRDVSSSWSSDYAPGNAPRIFPSVESISGQRLVVRWGTNMSSDAADSFDIRWQANGETTWTTVNVNGSLRKYTTPALTSSSYVVQIRATNGSVVSHWYNVGTATLAGVETQLTQSGDNWRSSEAGIPVNIHKTSANIEVNFDPFLRTNPFEGDQLLDYGKWPIQIVVEVGGNTYTLDPPEVDSVVDLLPNNGEIRYRLTPTFTENSNIWTGCSVRTTTGLSA